MDQRLQLLKELTEVDGISGYEYAVRDVLRRHLQGVAEEAGQDHLGSLAFRHVGTAPQPRIMLSGHMDEIGFMVNLITPEGYIKFVPVGGWWDQVLLGQRVVVKAAGGDVPGIIGSKPPHILPEEERKKVVEKKDMFIDVGARDRKEAMEVFGIRPGDPIVPVSPFTVLKNPRMVLAKAWDDRLGCALFIETLKELSRVDHPNTLYGVGTTQEEVGLRGAQTAADLVNPDICIATDVGIAGDMPGVKEEEAPVKLGAGPVLYVLDARLIPNRKLKDLFMETARQENLPLQFATMPGGATDGGAITVHGQGVPAVSYGVPVRYIHTHAGIIHLDDVDAAVKLLVAVIRRLDAATVAEIQKA
ncbi:MAG: M42 family metallopeptidase [Firmicutes bacterium]|nr:M42 family metallopeptidase [Bacillota bacterium]